MRAFAVGPTRATRVHAVVLVALLALVPAEAPRPSWTLLAAGLEAPVGEDLERCDDPTGRAFALHLVNVDGSGLERVTWTESFASFPMFSRDGAGSSSAARVAPPPPARSTSSSRTGGSRVRLAGGS
jgi:hypothetical protein